jgi:hypothetical protein
MAATASIARSAANNINFFNFYLLFRLTLRSTARWARASSFTGRPVFRIPTRNTQIANQE